MDDFKKDMLMLFASLALSVIGIIWKIDLMLLPASVLALVGAYRIFKREDEQEPDEVRPLESFETGGCGNG